MFNLQRQSYALPFSPAPPGFSTLDQLKRRNTLKDGIILIQTLLIILFIIVPIFLLLDKVPTGAGGGGSLGRLGGWHREDRTWAGSPYSETLATHPAPSPVHWLPVHSLIWSWRLLRPRPHPDPHPWPVRGQRWKTLTL